MRSSSFHTLAAVSLTLGLSGCFFPTDSPQALPPVFETGTVVIPQVETDSGKTTTQTGTSVPVPIMMPERIKQTPTDAQSSKTQTGSASLTGVDEKEIRETLENIDALFDGIAGGK